MTRREFLWSLPASVGAMGCLGLDPRTFQTPIEAAAFAGCANSVGFDLFREIRKQPGNLVCSPFLTTQTLALASAGARGETSEEFRKVLHWSDEASAIHSAAAAWQRQIAASLSTSRCELRAAYALWTDKSLTIQPEFRSIASKHYDGAWQSTDFSQPDLAVRGINQWAELHTAAKIRELVRGNDLSSVRMILAAGTFFKGMWAQSFPLAATSYDAFGPLNGAKSSAAYMRHIAPHRIFESLEGQMVELALAGRTLAVYAILPPENQPLAAFETAFDESRFRQWFDGLQSQPVVVTLPRFKITTHGRLSDALHAMGLCRAFRAGEADFSEISATPESTLGGVIHKIGIEVNEEGLETATATGAAARALDRPEVAEQSKAFVANRPFLFAVRDAVSGSMLFLGRVEKP